MAANTTVDIIINQKASFEVTFTVQENGTALDLTGYTTTAKMKADYETPDAQAISFTTAVANAAAGTIKMSLSSDQTANLQVTRYVYDLAIISSTGFKTRIVEGAVKVSGGVS